MKKEQIGNATLYLGDCLEILPEIGKVDAVVTDPPYAIIGGGSSIAGKGVEEAFDIQFYRVWFQELLKKIENVTTDNSAIWLTIDWRGCYAIEQAAVRSKFRFAGVGVWNRGGLGMGYVLRKTYENFVILVGEKWERKKTDEADVWECEWFPSSRKYDHQAEKPVKLMKRAIELTGGQIICDPFMGSGTAGIACIELDRKFVGIEINEKYFDIACKRIDEANRQGTLDFGGGE